MTLVLSLSRILFTLFLVSLYGRMNGSTCADYKCWEEAPGYIVSKSHAGSGDVSFDNCCVKSCEVHTCPEGYVRVDAPHAAIVIGDGDGSCCQATCDTWDCQIGHRQNLAQRNSTNLTEANCCHTTKSTMCGAYECPERYKSDNFRKSSDPNSIAKCCIPDETKDITHLFAQNSTLIYEDLKEKERTTRCCCEEGESICRLMNMSRGILGTFNRCGTLGAFYHSFHRSGRRCVIAEEDFEKLPIDLQAKWKPPRIAGKVRVEKIRNLLGSGYEDTEVYVKVSLGGFVVQTRWVRVENGVAIFNENLDLPWPAVNRRTLWIEVMELVNRNTLRIIGREDKLIGKNDWELSDRRPDRRLPIYKYSSMGGKTEQGEVFIRADMERSYLNDEL